MVRGWAGSGWRGGAGWGRTSGVGSNELSLKGDLTLMIACVNQSTAAIYIQFGGCRIKTKARWGWGMDIFFFFFLGWNSKKKGGGGGGDVFFFFFFFWGGGMLRWSGRETMEGWEGCRGCGGVASALSPNQRPRRHRSLTMGPISVQGAESQA